jgi:transketolase N-terminal domain/subunit
MTVVTTDPGIARLEEIARRIRVEVVRSVYTAKAGHLGSSASSG